MPPHTGTVAVLADGEVDEIGDGAWADLEDRVRKPRGIVFVTARKTLVAQGTFKRLLVAYTAEGAEDMKASGVLWPV